MYCIEYCTVFTAVCNSADARLAQLFSVQKTTISKVVRGTKRTQATF